MSRNHDIRKLLFVDKPLVVNPRLASEIGLNEAIVLQQISYWIDRAQYEYEGKAWMHKTADEWEVEFPFWSIPTIRRVLKSLEKSKYIKSDRLSWKFFSNKMDQTAWYSLCSPCDQVDNMQESQQESAGDQLAHFTCDQSAHFTSDQIDHLLTENTTENTTETTELFSSQNSSADNLKPNAVIQTPLGKKWGRADDLTTAQWIHKRVLEVNPVAPDPNWCEWANDIRLMNQSKKYSYRDICDLFNFANKHHFWAENIQCPKKLRKQWDTLTAQMGTNKPVRQGEIDIYSKDWADHGLGM